MTKSDKMPTSRGRRQDTLKVSDALTLLSFLFISVFPCLAQTTDCAQSLALSSIFSRNFERADTSLFLSPVQHRLPFRGRCHFEVKDKFIFGFQRIVPCGRRYLTISPYQCDRSCLVFDIKLQCVLSPKEMILGCPSKMMGSLCYAIG